MLNNSEMKTLLMLLRRHTMAGMDFTDKELRITLLIATGLTLEKQYRDRAECLASDIQLMLDTYYGIQPHTPLPAQTPLPDEDQPYYGLAESINAPDKGDAISATQPEWPAFLTKGSEENSDWLAIIREDEWTNVGALAEAQEIIAKQLRKLLGHD